jgi:lipoprotein-anchoring transpeptidase ErfK/SrfK
MLSSFRDAPKHAVSLFALVIALAAGSVWLVYSTAQVRFRRDINRIVFNQNWELLDQVKRDVGVANDSLAATLAASTEPTPDQPYVVVSIADRRLWYKQGSQTLYTTRVAVGSGKTLVKHGSRNEYKFDTPRGRLVVQSKEADPVWVPPDWHYVEVARKRGLGIRQLNRGQKIPLPDGSAITVDGNDVVKLAPNGQKIPFSAGEGREIIAGGNVIVPPFGTNQRKFAGVVGTHRLNLGDGYALHGTDDPSSIGKAVSHGCVRLRNEDIDYLFGVVAVGTPVFIY